MSEFMSMCLHVMHVRMRENVLEAGEETAVASSDFGHGNSNEFAKAPGEATLAAAHVGDR